MIITCAKCKKRYKLDDSKITARCVKFRCISCGSEIVFSKETEEADAPSAQAPPSIYSVLVSSEDAEIRKAVEETLDGSNIAIVEASDGEQTMKALEKRKPRIVIIDVALPGFHGFAICDFIKGRPDMKDTRVILTSAAFNRKRYKRRPTSLFGADDYIEKYDLPSELIDKINRFKVLPEITGRRADPGSRITASAHDATHAATEANTKKTQVTAEAAAPKDMAADEKARKLARVIAGDIILYHRKKPNTAVDRNNIGIVFKEEIEEGMKYFKKRLPSAAKAEIYLSEALLDFLNEARKKEPGTSGPDHDVKRQAPA